MVRHVGFNLVLPSDLPVYGMVKRGREGGRAGLQLVVSDPVHGMGGKGFEFPNNPLHLKPFVEPDYPKPTCPWDGGKGEGC